MSELEGFLQPILNAGVLGAIVLWFMKWAEKREDKDSEFKEKWYVAMVENGKAAQLMAAAISNNTRVIEKLCEELGRK